LGQHVERAGAGRFLTLVQVVVTADPARRHELAVADGDLAAGVDEISVTYERLERVHRGRELGQGQSEFGESLRGTHYQLPPKVFRACAMALSSRW
jgi:hypothetical protein